MPKKFKVFQATTRRANGVDAYAKYGAPHGPWMTALLAGCCTVS